MPKRNWLSVRAEHQPVLKTTGLHMTHLGGGALQLKSSRSWPAKLLGVSSCFSAVRFTSSNVPSGKKITASQVGVLASWFIFCLGCTALEMNKRRCINAVHSTVRTSF
ncbi:hypothetical protein BCR44DRAFT_363288 [Catenaria anguillulae PL171]|uniref:Uncharacterized protein n=1 Tax=Catenaria anguillulae PL171 TaxID=765915 RepID=A0A1Y2H3K2_9FUNG|nr:hypothetical protein BCR44DRAFT_363288 [Catenaria anguillulae PL171]